MPTIADEWMQQGREEGLEEGLRAGIQAIVELRFPESAESILGHLSNITSTDALARILESAKNAGDSSDLEAFITSQSNGQQSS